MEPQSFTLRFLWCGDMEVPERGRTAHRVNGQINLERQ